jgi:hypothetical protein
VFAVGVATTGEPLAELKLAAGLHVYVPAPLTLSVALVAVQIVFEVALVVNVGSGVTFTVAVAGLLAHPLVVPVTVYTVVVVGDAVGVALLTLLNPVPLVHV